MEDKFLTWNVGFGRGYAPMKKVDEELFVDRMLEEIEKEFPVKPACIYARGISNGAFLCHRLATRKENCFAAIAPVAGGPGGRSQEEKEMIFPLPPVRPVSVCMLNGELDRHVPVKGGLQERLIGEPKVLTFLEDVLIFRARASGCELSGRTEREDRELDARIITFPQGEQGAGKITGGGAIHINFPSGRAGSRGCSIHYP